MSDLLRHGPRRPRRSVVAVVAALATTVGGATLGLSDTSGASVSSECLDRNGERDTVAGEQFSAFRRSSVADGTVFDASTAVWNGRDENGEDVAWTVTLRRGESGGGSCWSGGEINGPWVDTDPGVTWEDPYHHAGGMTIELADFLIEDVRIDNQGDGIRTYGPDIRVVRAHLTDIHDDCIENDDVYSVTIEDSLLDGCYSGLSARPFTTTAPDGSRNLWTVSNSLIRLEPQPTVFKGGSPGHGGFFKWDDDGRSPQLAIHDTVLRADQHPNHGTLGIPDGLDIDSCSNNTVVWLGSGDFPGELPDCFTVTNDESVWNDAVAAWHGADVSVEWNGPARATQRAVRIGTAGEPRPPR